MENKDTELFNEMEFPDQTLAEIYQCEYAHLSNLASTQGMTSEPLGNWVNSKEISKVWYRASRSDVGWCQKPALSQVENAGTIASYLKANYAASGYPAIASI